VPKTFWEIAPLLKQEPVLGQSEIAEHTADAANSVDEIVKEDNRFECGSRGQMSPP
jgi:hypothetical protein